MYIKTFFEQIFFAPRWYHYIIILLLLPLAFFYGVVMWVRRKNTKPKSYGIPIISVGNLVVGGAGKTPFVIALAARFVDVVIVSRGYGRRSKGLIEVSRKGKILVDVTQSGDEPMLMALSLPNASVIVGEERGIAIEYAKQQGAHLVILDDGFNRVDIEKFEILLEPEKISNYYTFPAGPFREFYRTRNYADIIAKDGKEFQRDVSIVNLTKKMILVTAISNPQRLDRYLPKTVVKKIYYEDHAYFDEDILRGLLKEYHASSIICTSKDKVKMKGFKLPISEMKLKLEIKNEIFAQIDEYIERYDSEK